jgi:hypothetical protein
MPSKRGCAGLMHRGRSGDVVTVWWCESCNAKGTVTMAADAGVYEGFQRVWEAHTVTEPSCKGGRDTVRVQIDNEDRCGRLMVGSGPDTYDPVCELPIGHEPPCKSSAAIDQHRLVVDDPIQPYDSDHTALVHVLWAAERGGLTVSDSDALAAHIMRSKWMKAVLLHAKERDV